MSDLPWLVPGLLIATISAIVAGHRVGRELRAGSLVGALLVLSLGLILSVTLTPQADALRYGTQTGGTCDLGLAVPSLSAFLTPNDFSLNILLFVPLGAVIALVPRSLRQLGAVIAATGLPFVIEFIQLTFPALDRTCQASDIVTNVSGLTLGYALTWAALRITR